ncbi:hypothetical protein [Pseudohongiella sp. O18]|uniref:hypothetical protein n=1 Tax=Pseudohongiella sp. O18 TaxID=2904248 RepID=UPI001F32FBDE|nr:hypothetical protein [Pseudohongiella sp. O18]
MDISSVVKKNTTVVTDFRMPDGTLIIDENTKKPATIEIYGPDTDEHARLVAKRARELQLKNRDKKNSKDAEPEPVTEEMVKAQKEKDVESLAEITVSWTGWYEKGKPLKCTPENAKRLYLLIGTVRRKVDKAFGDEANFLEMSKDS